MGKFETNETEATLIHDQRVENLLKGMRQYGHEATPF